MDPRVKQAFDRCLREKVPVRFREVSLEKIAAKEREIVKAVADDLIAGNQPRGMIAIGDYGTGKTSALWVIAQMYWQVKADAYRSQNGDFDPECESDRINLYRFVFDGLTITTHFQLVKDLRDHNSGSADGRTTFPARLTTPILAIDDLGRGYDDNAGWNLALQDELIDWRWSRQLPTLVTTNKTAQELRSWSGWERMVDRLCDPAYSRQVSFGRGSRRR